MKIICHEGDLPESFAPDSSIAIDTETMGLNTKRDRLCLVQLSADKGAHCHLVRPDFSSPDAMTHLKALLVNPAILKIFHYARFDMAALYHSLGVMPTPVYCTKIASKLVRTYTDNHGLRDLCKTMLSVDISKQQQSSDWGGSALSDAQKHYAASDVAHLQELRLVLDEMLIREKRYEMAQSCFDFLAMRVQLDLAGFGQTDIFAH